MNNAEATVYCFERTLEFRPATGDQLQLKLSTFLYELLEMLESEGCWLIGHIKGLVEVDDVNKLFFSITSSKENINYNRRLTGDFSHIKLILYVIVYGLQRGAIEKIVLDSFKKNLQ